MTRLALGGEHSRFSVPSEKRDLLWALAGAGFVSAALVEHRTINSRRKRKTAKEIETEFDRLFGDDEFVEEVLTTEGTEDTEGSLDSELATSGVLTTGNALCRILVAQRKQIREDAKGVTHDSPGLRSLRSAPWVSSRKDPPKPEGLSQRLGRSGMLRWLILGTFLLAGALCFWKSNLLSHFDQPAVASIHSTALPETAQPAIAYELRSVADFKAGDPILAFNHETGEVETRYVKQASERLSDHLRVLTFISEDGQKQTIKTTNEHPFWAVERDDYIEAGDLQMGYKVRGPTGELLWLLSTRYEPHPEGVPVYNCEVEDLHNYFVSPAGSRAPPVLAHNADCLSAVNETGTQLARRLGREGEDAAQIVKNTQRIESLSGRTTYRIPDALTKRTLTEVKNVKYLHFSTQLRDSLHYSIMTNRQMILKTRSDTVLSKDLLRAIQAGWINLEFLR